jgi:putative NIF3 family GTP cyclohydrolase 1 type 2
MLDSVAADVVVTGDVSHHQARDAVARGIAVIDPGHAATERPGVRSLYAAVSQLLGDAIDLTEVDADPWKER